MESYQELGLNDRQIEILSSAIPKRQYYFESSHGNSLFDLGLGPISLVFASLDSPEKKKFVLELSKRYQGFEWIKEFLKHFELAWAIDIIEARFVDD